MSFYEQFPKSTNGGLWLIEPPPEPHPDDRHIYIEITYGVVTRREIVDPWLDAALARWANDGGRL